MSRFEHLLFVCCNQRAADDPKGCCYSKGSEALLERLKLLTAENKLKGRVRVTKSGCLDLCAKGVVVAAFSDDGQGGVRETWYVNASPDDAEALFESHVKGGEVYPPLKWHKA